MKVLKSLGLILGSVALSVTLAGCSDDNGDKGNELNKKDMKEHDLVWFEMVNNKSQDYVYYNLGYDDDGKIKDKVVKSTKIKEKILKDPDAKATIEKKDGTYIIKRQPYNILKQEDIEGEVKEKEVVK